MAKRLPPLLAAVTTALLLSACGGSEEATTVVPNLIGKDAASAQSLVERSRLRWRWEDGAQPAPRNGFLLADTIYGQSPPAGTQVPAGTEVMLVPGSSKIYAGPLG